MKPKYVLPYVCIDHEPNVSDSVHFGMPRLDVVQSAYPDKQFWFISCPVCGRGGIIQYKTAHEALKQWNILQSYCWHGEIFGLDATKPKIGVPEWKVQLYNKFFEERNEKQHR